MDQSLGTEQRKTNHLTQFKTHDLNFATFLKSRGWHVLSVETLEGNLKQIIFRVPGWDNEIAASLAFKEDTPLPAQTLLRNYHYCKNLVTRRKD